jgi:hypothetical protein
MTMLKQLNRVFINVNAEALEFNSQGVLRYAAFPAKLGNAFSDPILIAIRLFTFFHIQFSHFSHLYFYYMVNSGII